ncbi:MAG: PVC-type heme-binding CxxCH protein [Fimbriiglobus sp.]
MFLSWTRALVLGAMMVCGLMMLPGGVSQQKKDSKKAEKKDKPSNDLSTAKEFLTPAPRPKKGPLAPSELPLKFVDGERIALVGNTTAERMSLYGHFETMLQVRHPGKKLVVRNFAFPADEVSIRQRSADYTRLDDPLNAFNPDTFLCFFGWNESFQGEAGIAKFQADYEKFIDEYTARYPRDDEKSPARFVLVSPMAFENTGDKHLPDGKAENARLKMYTEAVKAVATKRKLAFVDIFTPTLEAFQAGKGKYTVGGFQANEAGDKVLGTALSQALLGAMPAKLEPGESDFERIRAAINDKNWVHSQDYRMVNGWYVYGGRRTFDTETFPREYAKLRAMTANRDAHIWDLASGKAPATVIDDSKSGELIVPPTGFGQPRQKYSENPVLEYQTPDEFIKSAKMPGNLEVKCFVDESIFPEIAKPVQMNFDNKGRLWVSTMPSYPQWRPGDPRAADKLVIFEDTNGDGKADKRTVFYDKLHCPTGFEFYNGGVLVIDQPRMLFLKDTNGDDKADEVTYLMDGWATDDTHHTSSAWEWNHSGLLHMLEGIATSTTLETPWGPHRSAGSGGAYVLDPRALKIRQFSLPGMANMWCYVFDEWGQGIVGDGTTQNQTWDTPLSGKQFSGRKGLNFILPNGERPNLGNEWLVSRALPDDMQKQFTYACVINMNGMTRYSIKDDGAGFMGERVKDPAGRNGFSNVLWTTDKHFRPADPMIGPDGALWFGDWANALIGHMQYSQRDPNRDHVRGRVYRLYSKDKPLVKPVTQAGKTVAEILTQFSEYEWRTRYRARRELHDRPASEVLPVVAEWVKNLNPADENYDRLRCEALWIQAGFHAVDLELAKAVLSAKRFEARSAVVHILADERGYLGGNLVPLFAQAAKDEHPRVRTEAARALSFYETTEAMAAIFDITTKPMDYWTKYTVEHSLGANEASWQKAFVAGQLKNTSTEAQSLMDNLLKGSKTGGMAAPWIKTMLSQEVKSPEEKNKAMRALADMRGNGSKGREVFQRNCVACHKVGNGEGQDYGPNMDKVATRLNRFKILESIFDPNADIEAKYLSTKIVRVSGAVVNGLLVSEDKDKVVIFDGKDKITIPADDVDSKTQLKQSSMPEGLAGTMSPGEFLDLIEYLNGLK